MAIAAPAKCAKILLIICNVLTILTGLAFFAIGIWLLADKTLRNFIDFLVADQTILFNASAGLCIAIGVIVVGVSGLGLFASIKESGILLNIYIALLSISLCVEFAAGVLAIVYQDKIIRFAATSMRNSIQSAMRVNASTPYYNYYNSTTKTCSASTTGASWDNVQLYFSCCGVGSYDMSGYNQPSGLYLPSICPSLNLQTNRPLTCCTPLDKSMKSINTADQTAYLNKFDCNNIIYEGCSDKLTIWIETYAPVLIGICIGFGMLQMVVIVFALCLCQHRGKDDSY